jgi:hypothetical protein
MVCNMNDTPTLDQATLRKLRPVIAKELKRLAAAGPFSPQAALKQVFQQLLPGHGPEDEVRYLMVAAPMARRLTIELANADDRIGNSDVRMQDVREWMTWFDLFDPLCAQMIDLHYFAGLSTRQTAAALKLTPLSVVRDLRFAKSWLQTKL